MKRLCSIVLVCCLLLGGCTVLPTSKAPYTETFLDVFDTVTTVIGRAESAEAFRKTAEAVHKDLKRYHTLFDIYHDYDGVANLKTVNDNAGVRPVTVDPIILDLLTDCKTYYRLTEGRVNVAMGSVLDLWHDARTAAEHDPSNATIPTMETLRAAAEHSDMDAVVIDREAGTVYITDAETRLDVGAVAKGWATQKVAENAPSGMLISVGGNVCATGPKTEDGTPWVVGIQDPNDTNNNLHTVAVSGGCVVTSGDYQRTYTVNGTSYHHIIDPQTLLPSTYWRSVSIVCEDSGLADALSTGLFLMDHTQGEALAKQCGADVLWVAADGTEYMTAGFQSNVKQ